MKKTKEVPTPWARMNTARNILTTVLEQKLHSGPPARNYLQQALSEIDLAIAGMGDLDQMFPPRPGQTQERKDETPEQRKFALLTGQDVPDADALQWASQFPRYFNKAGIEAVVLVSWLLFEHLGMKPHGGEKAWFGHIHTLREAGDDDPALLLEAIRDAKAARDLDKLTLQGPQSIVAFARNRANRARTEKTPDGRPVITI